MTKSIPSIFRTFDGVLKEVKEKISLLQIVGSNEDYLVKEFIYHIYNSSEGTLTPQANFGNTKVSKERQYDIAVLQGEEIIGILEAKYISNHSRGDTDHGHGSLRNLAEQLKKPNNFETHGGKTVKENLTLYGLVFLSHVSKIKNPEEVKEFKNEKCVRAKNYRLINWDMDALPRFKAVYKNFQVKGTEYFSSLYVGLWRLKS